MKLIKRWISTLANGFDQVISQVENHEALIASAVREMKQAKAMAQTQFGRIQADGDKLKGRLAKLSELESTWTQRAVDIHRSDENQALQCLRRKREVAQDIKTLSSQIREHQDFEQQLVSDLKLIDRRIVELERKKNAFSARQYRAQTLQLAEGEECSVNTEINEIFSRWEAKLSACEQICPENIHEPRTTQQEEEDEDLKKELASLLAQHSSAANSQNV